MGRHALKRDLLGGSASDRGTSLGKTPGATATWRSSVGGLLGNGSGVDPIFLKLSMDPPAATGIPPGRRQGCRTSDS